MYLLPLEYDTWTMYGSYKCSYTLKALELLENHESFVFIEIDSLKEIPELVKYLGQLIDPDHKTIPIIFRNGKYFGGYNSLIS